MSDLAAAGVSDDDFTRGYGVAFRYSAWRIDRDYRDWVANARRGQ